jgi:hypothetical protein
MKKKIKTKRNPDLAKLDLDGHMGCFGEYRSNDIICKKFCALNLKCIIERDNNSRIEILEDLFTTESAFQ